MDDPRNEAYDGPMGIFEGYGECDEWLGTSLYPVEAPVEPSLPR